MAQQTIPEFQIPDPQALAFAIAQNRQQALDQSPRGGFMGRTMGPDTAQGATFGAMLHDSLFGNPAIAQAQKEQYLLSRAQQSVQAQDGESQIDTQLRRYAAMRDAIAPTNPDMANQLNMQMLMLGEAKMQQQKLQADTAGQEQKNKAGALDLASLEQQSATDKIMGQPAYVVHADPKAPNGYDAQMYDLTRPDQAQAFQSARQAPGAQVLSQQQAATLFNQGVGANTRMKMALSLAQEREGQPLDPDTVHMAAIDVLGNPQDMHNYASFGQSGQMRRDQINQAVAQQLKAAGMTPYDLPGIRAQVTAESKSMGDMVKMLNNVNAFEGLARANGMRLLNLIKNVDVTGVPLIEGYRRYAARMGPGAANYNEFASVLRTFQTEAARIIANPNLSGQLSDKARNELEDVVSGRLDAVSMKRVINRLFLEMDIRKSMLQNQVQSIRNTQAAVLGGEATPGIGMPAVQLPYGALAGKPGSADGESGNAGAAPRVTAPAGALAYLKAHPESAPQFKKKYGYVP